jgi:putative ABC transport system permease protein
MPPLVDSLARDLRHGARAVARMRGTGLVAALTLGIGIGSVTTMFSVVYAALGRPLPFREPDRLAMLYVTVTTPRGGLQRLRWSRAEIDRVGAASTSFEALGSYSTANVSLTGGSEPQQVRAEVASPGYFRALGVVAVRGRTFEAAEDAARGPQPVALLSERLWRRRFGADPAILGRTVDVNRVALTVVGILPDGFAGLSNQADLWIPPAMAPQLTYGDYLSTPQHFISLIGRVKKGISIDRAASELATLAPRIVVPEPTPGEAASWSATAWPLGRARVDADARRSALALLAAVGCVLLVTCLNIAGLLLARARNRRREIAIRLAMGSGRVRLVRQLLAESLVLAVAGGAVGVLLSVWGLEAATAPAALASARNLYGQLGAFSTPALDRRALLFAAAVTLGTSVLAGLVPALSSTRVDLVTALKEDARGSTGGRRRVLAALVVAEIALAVPLLASAGLLVKSFAGLQRLQSGFEARGVLTFWMTPPETRNGPADGPRTVERVLLGVQRVPGVEAAAVNRCAPLEARCARTLAFFPERSIDPAAAPLVGRHYVSSDYFRTLGIPLLEGRTLLSTDRAGRPPVTVINETAARRFWPGEDPIGRRVWFGSGTGFTDPTNPVEVVGVVGDVKYGLVDDPVLPDFYTSYLQFTYPDTMILVKTSLPGEAIVPSLRAAVASADPGVPIYDVRTVDERIDAALARPRFNAALVAAFALAAVAIAGLGVYGVTTYAVALRLHEIGVRLALGADGGRVTGLVLRDGAWLAVRGAGLGLALAVAGGRLLQTLLFGVAPTDPAVLSAVAAAMVVVALAAALLPARRAASIDPLIVLRGD